MSINKFEYVNYASDVIIGNLSFWQEKILDYSIEFYQGSLNDAIGTEFGDCIVKSYELLECTLDNPTMFRGVINNNMLQAGAIIDYRFGEIYLYDEPQQHILIDIFCSAPWNCLSEPVEETRKGAAPWLITDLIEEINESSSSQCGIFKVAATPRAIKAYEKMGFQENPDGSREMILTPERALQFVERYKSRWK